MGNAKVIFGNETLIDLTGDTVSPNNLLSGATAHDRSGTQIVGTVTVPDTLDDLTDVDITSPTAGQVLKYDGAKWVNGNGGGGTTIVQIPSVVVGTYTYTGSAQGPTITGLDAAHTVVTGDTATNVGSYTLTIALADPQTMVWSDLTTADKTYAWSIGKAPGAVTLSKNTVVLSDVVPSDTVTISGATGAVSISSSDTGVATVSPSTMSVPGGVLTVTGAGTGTATITVSIAASSNYNATSATISASNIIAKKLYGAVWDGSADTSWTRTDDAASFADPQPYYAGMAGTPSSPFDNIEPWSGMVRSTDANAGEVVAIPKFYYKMGYASGTTGLKIQIAPAANGADWAAANGFNVSPAHMDRGDGAGERDVIYVGRYHCSSSYESSSGVMPLKQTNKATFRTNIHLLGADIWIYDYATLLTIYLLYLVEFANWNTQNTIGVGGSSGGVVENTGATDSMPYHTGTSGATKSTPGAIQYRYIEGLWSNLYTITDGLYKIGTSVYCTKNPADFANNTGGTLVGTIVSSTGYISAYDLPIVSGFEYALIVSASTGSATSYICDYVEDPGINDSLITGGDARNDSLSLYGLFFQKFVAASQAGNYIGSRLMVLP